MSDYPHRNSRNIPDGDTCDDVFVPSEIPFVSPDAASTDPRWTSDIPDHTFASMQHGVRVHGDEVTRRRTDEVDSFAPGGSSGGGV